MSIKWSNCTTRTCFHIYSAYYFGDFIQLQKLMWGIEIVKTVAIQLLTSISPSKCQ
ncbi:hypothetical protein E2C01_003973 [Portunus trituberculatus]|uniref:Uncharacterized protein n=1 Tax=Portunus trituberculatus TaxID=210409 RepID=A0A5B7CPD9_PORTR|nr:hypothetical protein [Portunus trituberculatus]